MAFDGIRRSVAENRKGLRMFSDETHVRLWTAVISLGAAALTLLAAVLHLAR
jgi:hypothetical protein